MKYFCVEFWQPWRNVGYGCNQQSANFSVCRGHFLGHVISSEGISQQANKLQAILNWPMLTDLKSVRSFVSLCSYYRKFVKDFAQIARPLTDLLRADGWKTPFTPEVLEAFEQLKVALTTALVLKFFDVHAESTLSVDASVT